MRRRLDAYQWRLALSCLHACWALDEYALRTTRVECYEHMREWVGTLGVAA